MYCTTSQEAAKHLALLTWRKLNHDNGRAGLEPDAPVMTAGTLALSHCLSSRRDARNETGVIANEAEGQWRCSYNKNFIFVMPE